MSRPIVKLSDGTREFYLEWSTVADGPTTNGMSIEAFRYYYRKEYGEIGISELGDRLKRVEETGTSSQVGTLNDLLDVNKAGDNEKHLSREELIQKYCTEISDFARVEDVADGLTADLNQRGFSSVEPKEDEVARYERRDSPIRFQVGVEQEYKDGEEPEFNHIYFALSYDLPERVNQHMAERMFPNLELMYEFFRNTSIFHHSLALNEDRFKDGRMNLFYHIGFEKAVTSTQEMRTVLQEIIDFFHNSISVNMQMLTRSLGE